MKNTSEYQTIERSDAIPFMKNQKAGDLFSVKREKVVEQKLMR